MSKRSAAGTTLIALGLATTSFGFLATGTASAAPTKAPAGNNGTIKVEHVDFSSGQPENNPHQGCTFLVEWYNYEKGNYNATVTFEPQAPFKGTLQVTSGNLNPFIGEDDADGVGPGNAGLDAREQYTLSFTGDPHDIQGYHVKLTINAPKSQGSDVKHKVFWVSGCETPTPTTPVSNPTTPVSSATTPASNPTTPISSATTPASNPTTPVSNPTTPISSATTPASNPTTPVSSATVLPTESESVPPPPETSTTATVAPTESEAPPETEESTTPTVAPSERTAPNAAPTAVDAGLAGDEQGGIPSSLLILLGAAMAVLGLGVGFVPIVARGKHSH
jgi:hypothetical protein